MRRYIELWQFMGFAAISLLGTVLHFLYDLLSGALWIAPFSAVNESTFEHMKLLFWPMLLFAVIQSFFFKRKDFLCIKLRGLLVGLMLIPVLFYTLSGAFGRLLDFINIAIFFVSTAVAYAYEARLLMKNECICKTQVYAKLSMCALALMFIIFTFAPPAIPLFTDPLSSKAGI